MLCQCTKLIDLFPETPYRCFFVILRRVDSFLFPKLHIGFLIYVLCELYVFKTVDHSHVPLVSNLFLSLMR